MRIHQIFTSFLLVLLMVGIVEAGDFNLVGLDQSPGTPFHGYLVAGQQKEIAWIGYGIDPKTTIKIELLKSGQFLRMLATGYSIAKLGPNAQGQVFGYYIFTPMQSDIGCLYTIKIAAENGSFSKTTELFGIFEAYIFTDSFGNQSFNRLDSPNNGVLTRGKTVNIIWTTIASPLVIPTGKIKLELYFQNKKVGDIAEIPFDSNKCPVKGQYSWTVGKLASVTNPAMVSSGNNLIAGNFYQIRINDYLGSTFVIALPSSSGGKPVPGGSPLPKVPKGGMDTIKN